MKAMAGEFVVYGERGWGNVAVEATLALIGAPYRVVDTGATGPERPPATITAQVPVLELPSGEIMSESAAILIWLADAFPAAGLAPPADSPSRPAFLRWMAFVSASIYALYWVRDVPARVVDGEAARAQVKARLDERIVRGWAFMEAQLAPGTWLLGEAISVLDIYVTVVSRWSPRRRLHGEIAPRIAQVVRRVEDHPRLAALLADRFPIGLDPSEA
jgi:GST-like protein